MILSKSIDRKDFYNNFYKTINSLLGLTKKELAILSLFASIRANLSQSISNSDDLDAANFGIKSRKLVASTLSISNYNLNNYIKSLRTKGILQFNKKGKITFLPSIYYDINSLQETFNVEFKFNII